MFRPKKTHLIWLAVILAGWYSTRSKTVQWDEEVPLNTGETIWVTRTVTYNLKGAGGNPFDIDYYPDKTQNIRFTWNGKSYFYEGYADLILLAISPNRQPVLIAPAANYTWDWNNDYRCASPHYVQFVPDESGRKWNWPPEIEPWLYGLPTNLMGRLGRAKEMQARYTAQQRSKEDATVLMQTPSRAKIEPKFTDIDCKKEG